MNTEQKQCLLRYLGYYAGAIDGVFGSGSRRGTAGFQADYGLEVTGNFGPEEESCILQVVAGTRQKVTGASVWDRVANFRREEFRCKCGGKFCDGFPVEPEALLVLLAQRVREHFGVSVRVSSGVRCQTHNANVGGVPGSRHKLGKAMDFSVRGKSSREVLAFVKAQPEVHYAYAIDGSYVHMDVE